MMMKKKNKKDTLRKFLLYLLKFELGTFVMSPTIYFLSDLGPVISVIIGNFIGACVFFPIDSLIFTDKNNKKNKSKKKHKKKKK